MKTGKPFAGVLAPVLTPFKQDLAPDPERLVTHCRWLLEQGIAGLAVFGTTSEANSLSAEERMDLLDALIAGGIRSELLMPGTGCCALTDTVRLTAHAVRNGCGGVLMLPAFYYKPVSDDGLFAQVAEVIERVGDPRLRIYLYHIPPVAVVGYSLDLIERLIKQYPSVVIGVKDSSGDWNNTEAILKRFPGSEVFLLAALRAGGMGCITATANVNGAAVSDLYERWRTPEADRLQAEITTLRKTIEAYPMIAALKQILAHFRNDPGWAAVRPPLVRLKRTDAQALIGNLEQKRFALAA
jgi:4-hydroxy-tetrahydrodipicolinate synthase